MERRIATSSATKASKGERSVTRRILTSRAIRIQDGG